jgi:ribose 1,5-bisphosphokinase PhnN
MVGAPGISSVSSQSKNLRRVKTRRSVVTGAVAGPSGAGEPRYYEEDPATQAAHAALDFSWDLGDSSLDAQADDEVDDGIKVVVNPPRNKNSVSRISVSCLDVLTIYARIALCKPGFR